MRVGIQKVVVLITATTPVRYSSDNGFSTTEYDPGLLYEVLPHVAAGMYARRWCRYANAADVAAAEAEPEPDTELPPLSLKGGDEDKPTKQKGQQDGERK